jgi:membrane associated rhomboid family serine protease
MAGMSTLPPESPGPLVDDAEETFCYGHPDTPTKLRCSRCDRPICGRCAIPASVGQHCPECVAEGRKSQRKVRSTEVKTAPATVTIIAICVGFFVIQQLVPGVTSALGAYPPAIADGEWWRLLTPMLLHAPATFWHIGFNMFALWIYGPQAERGYGSLRYVALFVVTGFTGGALSFLLSPCRILGVGASGAIFGVIGGLLAFVYNRRSSQFVAHYMRGLLGIIALNLFIGFTFPGIDNWAHIGGLVGGVLLGYGFDKASSSASGKLNNGLVALAVIALGVALVVYRTTTFTCAAG